MSMELKTGNVCRCSRGYLGVLTSGEPTSVVYSDNSRGVAYAGIHLSVGPGGLHPGSPWCSRHPTLVAESVESLFAEIASMRDVLREISGASELHLAHALARAGWWRAGRMKDE